MNTELKVIDGMNSERENNNMTFTPAERLRTFRNMAGSMMEDALGVWTEIYGQLESALKHGVMVRAGANSGFIPGCGWPEFMEKMWLLKHYLDHMKRICEGKA